MLLLSGALFNFMRLQSREKTVEGIDDMVEGNYKFYILESSQEFVAEMPKVTQR